MRVVKILGIMCIVMASFPSRGQTDPPTEPPVDPSEIGSAPKIVGPMVLQDEELYGGYHDALALEGITITALILDFEGTNRPRFDVWRRDNKAYVATLPDPSIGRPWIKPFALQRLDSQVNIWTGVHTGRFIAVDSYAPAEAGYSATPPRVIEYEFEFNLWTNSWSVTELRIVHLPMDTGVLDGMWYPTSVKVMDNGRLVIADTAQGSLWVSDDDTWSSFQIAYASPTLFNSILLGNPSYWDNNNTINVYGEDVPGFHFKTYNHDTGQFEDVAMQYNSVFGMPGAWMPGLHGVSYIPSVPGDPTKPALVAFATSGPDGNGNAHPISALPVSILLDETIPFNAKDQYLQHIVPATNGHTDWIAEVPWPGKGRWLYYVHVHSSQDDDTAFAGRLSTMYRAHIDTGEVQKVFEDYYLLDFTSNQGVGRLPYWMPQFLQNHIAVITTTNTRQHLTYLTNYLLTYFGYGEGYEGPVNNLPMANFFDYQPWRRATETWVWVN